jgi:hypothetical protein
MRGRNRVRDPRARRGGAGKQRQVAAVLAVDEGAAGRQQRAPPTSPARAHSIARSRPTCSTGSIGSSKERAQLDAAHLAHGRARVDLRPAHQRLGRLAAHMLDLGEQAERVEGLGLAVEDLRHRELGVGEPAQLDQDRGTLEIERDHQARPLHPACPSGGLAACPSGRLAALAPLGSPAAAGSGGEPTRRHRMAARPGAA